MRKRLTAKTLKAETRADGLFPGDVGQPDREERAYHAVDEYNNEASELKEGWDTTSKEDTWSASNEREEGGWGKRSKLASAAMRFRTAKKATVLANMLLGDEAPVEEIKEQAKEFMALGYRGICASIRRYADTMPEEVKACGEEGVCPTCGGKAVAEEAPAATPAVEAETEADPEVKADEENLPEVEAETEEVDLEGEVEDTPAEPAEEPAMVIDIPEEGEAIGQEAFNPDAQVGEGVADPALEAMFSGAEEAPAATPAEEKVTASKKAGIKHLAGQPKLVSASKVSAEDLSNLWESLTVRSF